MISFNWLNFMLTAVIIWNLIVLMSTGETVSIGVLLPFFMIIVLQGMWNIYAAVKGKSDA